MNWYFIALSIMVVLSLGIDLERHGRTEMKRYNFFWSLVSSALLMFLVVMAIRHGF